MNNQDTFQFGNQVATGLIVKIAYLCPLRILVQHWEICEIQMDPYQVIEQRHSGKDELSKDSFCMGQYFV